MQKRFHRVKTLFLNYVQCKKHLRIYELVIGGEAIWSVKGFQNWIDGEQNMGY